MDLSQLHPSGMGTCRCCHHLSPAFQPLLRWEGGFKLSCMGLNVCSKSWAVGGWVSGALPSVKPSNLQSTGRGEPLRRLGGCLWPALCHVREAQPNTNLAKPSCWISVLIVKSRTNLLITALSSKLQAELKIIWQVIYFTHRFYLF